MGVKTYIFMISHVNGAKDMSLPHFILGTLSDLPMTGYDLNKFFRVSINHFWSTDQSQIYRALQSLKKDGLVRDEHVVQKDHPNKKVYYVTDAGRKELQRWLENPLSDSDAPVRQGWMGQLFFGNHGELSQIIEVMKCYFEEEREGVKQLNKIRDNVFSDVDASNRIEDLHKVTLNYGIRMRRAALESLGILIQELEALD